MNFQKSSKFISFIVVIAMPKIHRLSVHEAQKIAAGEVVDRPANVVKELVENSLDAGATQISVYIEKAGKKLIRIVDNGCGMDADDAHLCFEQHATSKIKAVEELQHVATFGFRGEALPSIAAVSTVTLITKEKDTDFGTKIVRTYGSLVSCDNVASPTGTDIAIANLFENVPARKKFLKTDDTEWRAIVHLMHAFCLDYLNVHIKLFHDGKQVINCPATDTLEQRIAQLWDTNLASAMLSFTATPPKDGIVVHGATSHHQYYRYDRSSIYLFVNKRWVKNHQLVNAIVKGYQNVLPQGRYPATCLFIDITPQEVDINIHPRKEEVLFLHPLKVTAAIYTAIKQRLEEHLSSHLKKPVTIASTLTEQPPFAHNTNKNDSFVQKTFSPFDFDTFVSPRPHNNEPAAHFNVSSKLSAPATPQPYFSEPLHETTQPVPTPPPIQHEQHSIAQQEHSYTLIGQYLQTYILIENNDGLCIVDQHAAHERILYELFQKRFHDVATSQLLFPLIISLSETEASMIESHATLFVEHGITVSRFSRDQIIVESLPVHLKNASLDDLFKQTVGWLQESHHLDASHLGKTIHEKLRAQMACKAAVKAGDILTREKMEQLLQDLNTTDQRLTCPHGRPTMWVMSVYELEKKFKRKL